MVVRDMTRSEFITYHRQTGTVLVYKHPDMFRVTATSKHVIGDNTMTIGKRVIDLTGWTVAVKP
jgi:hypothetical protein